MILVVIIVIYDSGCYIVMYNIHCYMVQLGEGWEGHSLPLILILTLCQKKNSKSNPSPNHSLFNSDSAPSWNVYMYMYLIITH